MRTKTKGMIAGIVVLTVCLGGYLAAGRALDHFVRDGTLVRLIGRKTAVILEADTGYLPVTSSGLTVRSDGILVRAKPPRSLTQISAANLRAFCSLQNLWQRKWTIKRLQASHLQAAFGEAAESHLERILPREPELQPPIETSSPLKLEIRETIVPRTDVFWGQNPEGIGYLKDIEARFYPKDHGLDVFGRGGTFRQTGWPELKVDELRLHYAKPQLAVESAIFSIGQPRNFTVKGAFKFGEGGEMQLHLHSAQTPAEPFIMGFWHGKLEGSFDSESDLHEKYEANAKVDAAGEIHFTRAMVHDVPALKQIATITRHPQFEKPKIDVLNLHYRWSGTRLDVTQLEAEIKGLMRIEGEFAVDKQNIEGKFKIGVAPDVAESIPGAREKVFTESRGSYLWTSMTLSGPASHPHEDLKQRLVAAAKEHLAKGFLAPIFKPGKSVLEMLDAIYQ
ncbi:MAG: hypothetical protein QOH39_2759 [Verrucomicrobiota bacterium]|jgi:hypothetical protein